MARDEFREARFGFAQLPMVPPFAFSGMTTRMFPLRANLNALQEFCDGYLNIIPPALGRFKVAAPYVFLMMIDYGRMSSRAVNQSSSASARSGRARSAMPMNRSVSSPIGASNTTGPVPAAALTSQPGAVSYGPGISGAACASSGRACRATIHA